LRNVDVHQKLNRFTPFCAKVARLFRAEMDMSELDLKIILSLYFETSEFGPEARTLWRLHLLQAPYSMHSFGCETFSLQEKECQMRWLNFIDTRTEHEWTERDIIDVKHFLSVLRTAHATLHSETEHCE
jgi:hypothetical protein